MKLTATSAPRATPQRQQEQGTKVGRNLLTVTTSNQQGCWALAQASNNERRLKVLGPFSLLPAADNGAAVQATFNLPCSPRTPAASWTQTPRPATCLPHLRQRTGTRLTLDRVLCKRISTHRLTAAPVKQGCTIQQKENKSQRVCPLPSSVDRPAVSFAPHFWCPDGNWQYCRSSQPCCIPKRAAPSPWAQ